MNTARQNKQTTTVTFCTVYEIVEFNVVWTVTFKFKLALMY